jgi:uncharacterized membrane protein YidH (DUF202 family)
MKSFGLMFNTKRMFIYFILLIIGLSLMTYGILSYYDDRRTFDRALSDEEIIERAKALGLVEVKDKINGEKDEN